jgi:hypothetical protein
MMRLNAADQSRKKIIPWGEMGQPTKRRDPRLDFFRGVAMLIIFIAHVPGNMWAFYIPARYGWSDAAEMFVFCSGYAAAIAFGGTFVRAGFWYGLARVMNRIWQLYTSHLLIFFLILALCAAGTAVLDTKNYVNALNLGYFVASVPEALIGLVTLTYVPNYFDILPMYMGALLLIPVAMLLARVHPWLPLAGSAALWLANWVMDGGLPAHPKHPELEWFFNPMGWQILFITGFALSRGWVKAPPVKPILIVLALVFVVVSIPFYHWPTWTRIPVYEEIHDAVSIHGAKTDYGLLRYVHFFCLAYLAIAFVKGREHLLEARWAKPILKVGQQALPVFLLNMWLAQLAGMALDVGGRSVAFVSLVNLIGLACVVGFAYLVSWIKSSPWQAAAAKRASRTAAPVPGSASDQENHRSRPVPQPAE